MTTQGDVTAKLQELHEGAGSPSHRAIERALVTYFGDEAPSNETIRLYHMTGGIKRRPDTATLGMLAWYYGVDVAEISEGAGRVLVLLGGGVPADLKKPGIPTRSNRTGPGRNSRAGRRPGPTAPVAAKAAA